MKCGLAVTIRLRKEFVQRDGTIKKFGYICWHTNLDLKKRHKELIMVNKYTPEEYPYYDNYDAIKVNKVANIPYDYDSVMSVPITFLDMYTPKQFESLGYSRKIAMPIKSVAKSNDKYQQGGNAFYLRTGGHKLKRLYKRIAIRRRSPESVPEQAQGN